MPFCTEQASPQFELGKTASAMFRSAMHVGRSQDLLSGSNRVGLGHLWTYLYTLLFQTVTALSASVS